MSVFTIISDWHTDGLYISSLKGKLFQQCPLAKIIDITHQIKAFNITEAGYILKSVYKNFPDNTIHLICVNNESETNASVLVGLIDNQYFIASNNGILSLLRDSKPDKLYVINHELFTNYETFPELEIFAKVATFIANGGDISSIGYITSDYKKLLFMQPTWDDTVILGRVIYIDAYQNIITNITKFLFEQVRKNRSFNIFVKSNHNKISQINRKYSDSPEGELLAVFNAFNYLEIAMNKGNIAGLLGIELGANIRVNFY